MLYNCIASNVLETSRMILRNSINPFYKISERFVFSSLCFRDSKYDNKLSWHKINWIQNGIPKSHEIPPYISQCPTYQDCKNNGRSAICSCAKFISVYLMFSLDFYLWFCLKVSKNWNDFIKTSFLPKTKEIIVRISALWYRVAI